MAITEYINTKGDLVVITKMPDAYLLNSYAAHRKRLQAVQQSKMAGSWWLQNYTNSIKEIIDALRAEIDRRGLV